MEKLIELIERASIPDREIDALIEVEVRRWQAYEVGLNDEQRAHWRPIGNKGEVICTQGITRYHPPVYTFEIDKALALVPDGWQWQVSNRAPKPNAGRAYVHNNKLQFIGGGGLTPNPKYKGNEATAATPALALCAAALRARGSLVSRPHLSTPESK